MYDPERNLALTLCQVLATAYHHLTEQQLAETALHGGLYDRCEFAAGLKFARDERWIRSAHVGLHLVLTAAGLAALRQQALA